MKTRKPTLSLYRNDGSWFVEHEAGAFRTMLHDRVKPEHAVAVEQSLNPDFTVTLIDDKTIATQGRISKKA
jgi:hypothetical protein